LAGKWQFRRAGTGEWLTATAPGYVYTDLFDLLLIPDMEDLVDAKFFLVADRLDTQAKVNLNGKVLSETNNQIRK